MRFLITQQLEAFLRMVGFFFWKLLSLGFHLLSQDLLTFEELCNGDPGMSAKGCIFNAFLIRPTYPMVLSKEKHVPLNPVAQNRT